MQTLQILDTVAELVTSIHEYTYHYFVYCSDM